MREAVADIDEEVARLNRIVNEVLDFARPIRFELAPVDLNALCRESAAAAEAAGSGAPVTLDARRRGAARSATDAERLRIALVNMLVNARHAVNGDGSARRRRTSRRGARRRHARARACRSIASRSSSPTAASASTPADLAHIFDPYFTTKRGGTGLGLPIAKNIVEGLGGTIAVASALGRGTEIRIELPLESLSGSTDS